MLSFRVAIFVVPVNQQYLKRHLQAGLTGLHRRRSALAIRCASEMDKNALVSCACHRLVEIER
jgi:hypothetical protein